MLQVEWGPSVETANGTRQNVNVGKLENNVLVQEIDLSYAILPWNMNLDSGKMFTKTLGDKVGFRYYEDESRGILSKYLENPSTDNSSNCHLPLWIQIFTAVSADYNAGIESSSCYPRVIWGA